MKISKKVALPLLLVIMLGAMGLSYAWWNETLTINGTVNTGELKLSWYVLSYWPPESHYPATSWHYATSIPWDTYASGNTLDIALHNMYPSAEVKFYIRIYNTGTIPAKITGYKVTKTGGDDTLYNNLEVKYSMVHYYTGGDQVVVFTTGYMAINNFESHLNAHGKTYPYPPGPYGTTEVILKPGDYLAFDDDTLYFHVNSNAGSEIEGKSVTFTIEVDFIQWNAP
jgi:predicted ribosomally synthesized peptide with SipW-like signal peptide